MTRQELIKRWGISDPGPPLLDPEAQESLRSTDEKTEAFITSQGRVCTILGGALEYRGHKLRLGATKVQLTKLLGTPETKEYQEGPGFYGNWSYEGGCIQAHYDAERTVSGYELRMPGIS